MGIEGKNPKRPPYYFLKVVILSTEINGITLEKIELCIWY